MTPRRLRLCCALIFVIPAAIAAAQVRAPKATAAGAWPLADGGTVSWSAASGTTQITLASGAVIHATPSHVVRLRYAAFDPLLDTPPVEPALAAAAGDTLRIVQFHTQLMPEYRAELAARGVEVLHPLGGNAFVARLATGASLSAGDPPFVRWVGAMHAAFKLEQEALDALRAGHVAPVLHHVQTIDRGLVAQQAVGALITAIGGTVERVTPAGFVLDARLTPAQALAVARSSDVLFVELKRPRATYMDIVREVGGANYVETVAGYTGQGVRAEIIDGNLRATHVDFQQNPVIFHGPASGNIFHGTSTYGILFGSGAGSFAARGMLPDAQGIFADYDFMVDRYAHFSALATAPLDVVLQSSSIGNCCSTEYTTQAAEMDDVLFHTDVVALQAMANTGTQSADVVAFAKNIVTIGGIRHFDTLTLADDQWANAGSVGPASDGRIKPDLSFFYDNILTTSGLSDTAYTLVFGGTSAATPMSAGHFGLMFQMWSEGLFGNPVDPEGTVFSNRPRMATAKALMINTALPYMFDSESTELRRTQQGYGLPNVRRLYDWRDMIFVVDAGRPIRNLYTHTYRLQLAAGAPHLRATLVYSDPAGTPNSQQHRVNDLTLRVIAPDGTVYWGNHGLLDGNASPPGGEPDTINTVENVWLKNPAPGLWRVQIIASEIVQDTNLDTPELDADYALVVTGVLRPGGLADLNGDGCVNQADLGILLADFGCTVDCVADVNGDGTTDQADLGVLLSEFGCP